MIYDVRKHYMDIELQLILFVNQQRLVLGLTLPR